MRIRSEPCRLAEVWIRCVHHRASAMILRMQRSRTATCFGESVPHGRNRTCARIEVQKFCSQGERRRLAPISVSHITRSDKGRSRQHTGSSRRLGAIDSRGEVMKVSAGLRQRPAYRAGGRDDFAVPSLASSGISFESFGATVMMASHDGHRPASITAARASSRVGKMPSGMPSARHARQKPSTVAKWPRRRRPS